MFVLSYVHALSNCINNNFRIPTFSIEFDVVSMSPSSPNYRGPHNPPKHSCILFFHPTLMLLEVLNTIVWKDPSLTVPPVALRPNVVGKSTFKQQMTSCFHTLIAKNIVSINIICNMFFFFKFSKD